MAIPSAGMLPRRNDSRSIRFATVRSNARSMMCSSPLTRSWNIYTKNLPRQTFDTSDSTYSLEVPDKTQNEIATECAFEHVRLGSEKSC